jgi:hypothetical protein
MAPPLWDRKEIALIVAILMLACAAAFLSVKLTRPKPFGSAALSALWQCTATPGSPAICSRKHG